MSVSGNETWQSAASADEWLCLVEGHEYHGVS
jgi:hypothetical protein